MQEFTIAPAGTKAFWIMALVLLPVVVLLVITLLGSRTARFEVSPDGLRLRGDLYGRFVPAEQLQLASATRVDFRSRPELTPQRRTLGTGLPGYSAGWFRLRNGDKALLYLTDRTRAVYIPTSEGYGVMVSPQDPDGFLKALLSIQR